MEGGGQIFYEWGSASHRKLFMWWWVAGVEGWGVGVEGRQRGHSFIWCWRGEKEMKREGGGKNSVNERVMERTVRERERERPSTQNEWERHTQLYGLIAGWAPAQSSLCQLSRTSARDQPKAWPLARRESHTEKQTRFWLDALYGPVTSRLTECSRTDSVINSCLHL